MVLNKRLKRENILGFSSVIICTLLIYLTIPFAREVSDFLSEHKLFSITVYILLSIFIIAIIYFIIQYIGFRLVNIITIVPAIAIYVYIIQSYEIIAEKIHFIEYGILAFLLYNTLKTRLRPLLVYLYAFLMVSVIGWGDELIQYFLPDRVYDLRDVFLNSISGGIMLILIYIVEILRKKQINNIS